MLKAFKSKLWRVNVTLCCIVLWLSQTCFAHSSLHQAGDDEQATATYLANEAVMISFGDQKILFDPFFHRHFNTYALVPDDMKKQIMAGAPPFDNIDAIFVSHAHGDHFSDKDTLAYLEAFAGTRLFAPEQAAAQLRFLAPSEQVMQRVTAISLAFGDAPQTFDVAGMKIAAVRIPHAGWPGRANVQNLVFRVSLTASDGGLQDITVMHMGDADPDPIHYQPHSSHWQSLETHLAMPPYWFYLSADGNNIINNLLNAQQSVGIHVPIDVPQSLIEMQKDFFSKPGETRQIIPQP